MTLNCVRLGDAVFVLWGSLVKESTDLMERRKRERLPDEGTQERERGRGFGVCVGRGLSGGVTHTTFPQELPIIL